MSKNVKIILIIVGIFAFLSIVCVGGLGFLSYYFIDNAGIDKSMKDGTEFGKTTDNLGCQTKIVSMIKSISPMDINETLKAQYYFDSCLESSRPTPSFCDGVPNAFGDIFKDDKGKDAECAKLGFKEPLPCRQIIEKKLDFCGK